MCGRQQAASSAASSVSLLAAEAPVGAGNRISDMATERVRAQACLAFV